MYVCVYTYIMKRVYFFLLIINVCLFVCFACIGLLLYYCIMCRERERERALEVAGKQTIPPPPPPFHKNSNNVREYITNTHTHTHREERKI